MAANERYDPLPAAATPPQHQRAKSSVLKNFVHRRQPSRGEALVPEPQSVAIEQLPESSRVNNNNNNNMGVLRPPFGAAPPLGERRENQQEPPPRLSRPSSEQQQGRDYYARGRSLSPTKISSNPFHRSSSKDASKASSKGRETSPSKPKKTKSGTNLAGLLSRPKSLKNIYKFASEEESKMVKDKENRTPDGTMDAAAVTTPPIYAQFTSDASVRQQLQRQSVEIGVRNTSSQEIQGSLRPAVKARPKSFQVTPSTPQQPNSSSWAAKPGPAPSGGRRNDSNPLAGGGKSQRSKVFGMLTGKGHSRSKSVTSSPTTTEPAEPLLDPGRIDELLEAMLDRRNIPENQRYKMRNLNDTIKMEFIRQDWAETRAAQGSTENLAGKEDSGAVAPGSDNESEKPKRSRGKSFTFSRDKKEGSSPTKKSSREGTLGRHFRSKSTESVVSEDPALASSAPNTNIFSKIKLQQGPGDYVNYMRKVQKPELVEVGKIHKLRLLLRNETVAWIEEFMQKGGMKEIIGLLNRIMDVEWREEHEDALLHENLLCLKALSTTASGIRYIDTVQGDLFPKLLQMLFDPEKKGPSEYTTRNIITSVLFTYIESATPAERVLRTKSILAHLRDPQPKEDEAPLPFVLEMRQERPYRVWNKEVVSVTKEVFWIFLHNLNVVAMPSPKSATDEIAPSPVTFKVAEEPYAYMLRNFPQERPPVPAAPYVGGVEWDATNYLASHLDLMNAILACTPTLQARNALRAHLRISGWERCMGGSLRLCKEKFYGSVHDGLRTWVAAAVEDGWDVRDVRYGPPAESRSPPKKAGGGQKLKTEDAPKLDMPKLDLALPPTPVSAQANDAWL